MTKGQRTIASLLAVIAVLLGLNLVVRGSPAAAAQATTGPTPPIVVAGQIERLANPGDGTIPFQVFRFWSDGTVDQSKVSVFASDPGCEVAEVCDPVQAIPLTCAEDINGDLSVNVLDLIEVLLAFGVSCR